MSNSNDEVSPYISRSDLNMTSMNVIVSFNSVVRVMHILNSVQIEMKILKIAMPNFYMMQNEK
jgi:hypothetical protein